MARPKQIGIMALKDLLNRYEADLNEIFNRKHNQVARNFNDQIRLFIEDISPKELKANAVVSEPGYRDSSWNLNISIVKERNDNECRIGKGIECPLLQEKENALNEINKAKNKANRRLTDWYHDSLKPVDFVDFNPREVAAEYIELVPEDEDE